MTSQIAEGDFSIVARGSVRVDARATQYQQPLHKRYFLSPHRIARAAESRQLIAILWGIPSSKLTYHEIEADDSGSALW